MTRKIELKPVAIGAVISIVGSTFLTVFTIFWAGFIAADSGLEIGQALSVPALGIAILVIDAVVGLIAGFVAGRLASAHPIAQGVVVGAIAVILGLFSIAWASPPWRVLIGDSIVSMTAPVFGAKFADWQRRRRAEENAAAWDQPSGG